MALLKAMKTSGGADVGYIQARECKVEAIDKLHVAVKVALFEDLAQRQINNTPVETLGQTFTLPFDPVSATPMMQQVYDGLKAEPMFDGAVDG